MNIRPFRPGDEAAFRTLNEVWIKGHFRMEPKDYEIFADPQRAVLDHGGHIFIVEKDGQTIACIALLAIAPHEYELAKMAVSEGKQNAGIGRALLQHIIDFAKNSGTRRLYVESNHVLAPAVHLYESLGFQHLPAERIPRSPYQRADVFMEMLFAE